MVWLKRDSINPLVQHTTAGEPAKLADTLPSAPQPQAATSSPARPSEVLEKVRKLIEDGHFPPGSRLPPERALAAQLGVGRPSLREAIKALNVLEVLESRRGAGTFVKSRRPSADPWGDSEEGSAELGVMDLLEVRKIIEPRAAWLAATRASERHLVEIEAARQKLEVHGGDWRLAAKLDHELHSAIIRGAQNPVLDMIDRFLHMHIVRKQTAMAHFVPDLDRIRRDHKTLVETILKRQADAAEKAMIDHLNAVGLEFISEVSR
jgi:GntR family transcriptional regulator, transcriptional repressor for pyruvate dehydrogenase complex